MIETASRGSFELQWLKKRNSQGNIARNVSNHQQTHPDKDQINEYVASAVAPYRNQYRWNVQRDLLPVKD